MIMGMNRYTGEISPATHHWRGGGYTLGRCLQCKKQTTGRVKLVVKATQPTRTKSEKALCSDCAAVKGFTR